MTQETLEINKLIMTSCTDIIIPASFNRVVINRMQVLQVRIGMLERVLTTPSASSDLRTGRIQ